MDLLRSPLLLAARSPRMRTVAEKAPLVRPVVKRFVAGAEESDALRVVRDLDVQQMSTTLDFLGEDTTSAAQAEHTVAAYESVLGAVSEAGLSPTAEVSVKLSAIGQSLPDGDAVALAGARRICAAAAAAGTTVTIDMEDHTTTDSTLAIVRQLREQYPWVGAVLQAYLRRTEDDCREFSGPGSRIRLCKGAYAEPDSVAYSGDAVDDSYRRCADILLSGQGHPMLATHDPAMIAHVRSRVQEYERPRDSFEMQMLYGVRPDAQLALAREGVAMRVYVPYGDEWYGYFMRRLAERPANLTFFFRAMASRT